MKNIDIRETTPADFEDIMKVERRAFGQEDEAKLTADLLNDPTAQPILSLLAFYNDKAIGHILFTRLYLNEISEQPLIHLLAPMAVLPEFQNQGIGGKLIKTGLEKLKAMGSEVVFVLGHIDYYPKYGFINDAGKLGYQAPYPIPDEVADAWMIQTLNSEGIKLVRGKIKCAKQLDKPEYWSE